MKIDDTPLNDRPFDYRVITDTIERSLASAGLVKEAGLMRGITGTIHQALSAAGLYQPVAAPSDGGTVIDGVAREVDESPDGQSEAINLAAPTETTQLGEFVSRSFTNEAGTRAYKLYVPTSYSSESGEFVPLVVMLHGCSQTPDDFAAGTRMNALAEQHGFLVAYPAQAANANGGKCWNWFLAKDQGRDRGEPSLLAGITRHVVSNYRIDERSIFVAGMSAGAAMAVILGVTYPELFAAVGAHSGLPYGAAHDKRSAFGAMKGGGTLAGMANNRPHAAQAVPTIVFHGECDRTVDARNGAAIVEQATIGRSEEPGLRANVLTGRTSGGRSYRRTVYADAAGHPAVEYWVLEGAGHAWSGGCPGGSFTDARGPDASAEMIRFFYSRRRAGTA